MNYDESKYKVLTWKHWTMLHYIINPVVAITELLLGIRFPRVILYEKYSVKPLMERQFVPCPHCGKLNDGRLWFNRRRFKNWFGLYCPECGDIIPCLMNLTTFLLLAITYPLWIGVKKPLKRKWLEVQPERFRNINPDDIKYFTLKKKWIVFGLLWGAFMLVFFTYLKYVEEEKIFHWSKFLIHDVPICFLGGLVVGYLNKKILGKKGKVKKEINE